MGLRPMTLSLAYHLALILYIHSALGLLHLSSLKVVDCAFVLVVISIDISYARRHTFKDGDADL